MLRFLIVACSVVLGACSQDNTAPGGSSDADPIVFAGFGTNTLNLFSARPDGSGLRQLTHGPGRDYFPRFSPSADTIAFLRMAEGDVYQIWLLDLQSLETSQLTHDTLRKNGGLAWSPDGSRIVFSASETSEAKWDLYILDIHTKRITNITAQLLSDRSDRSFVFPDWSIRDEIVFSKNDSLYWITPTGRVLQKEHYNGAAVQPRWSPNGEFIAFTHISGSGYPPVSRIAIIDRWGRGFRILTGQPDAAQAPAWSPSATEIAYASNRAGDFEIFVIPIDGGTPQNISNRPGEDDVPAWR